MEFEIVQIMEELSKKRLIFHSEADFQHALAWEIHLKSPESKVRLERRFLIGDSEEIYTDIFIERDGKYFVIETKYTTKEVDVVINGERFVLKNHSGEDIRRYDFLMDVVRLEKLKEFFKSRGTVFAGYAIFLTNVPAYWKPPRKEQVNYYEFRICEGREIKANTILNWGKNTGKGTKRGREKPLKFRKNYRLNWRDYSKIGKSEFKYLLVEVS